ncbi:phosphatidate cytidylyltransferase [Haloimpatiens sp. FM7330]|uniref:phosphatidate cytidylyltransferase n=1 Tax=Haloimpatiens sp. FM7330 TaxID=3298610 RepID=UPI00363F1B47
MNKRYIGALFLAPLLIFLFIGGMPLKILTVVLSLLGLYEFFKVVKQGKIKPFSFLAYALTLVYYFLLKTQINYDIFTLGLILITLLMLCIPIINIEYTFIDVAVTILGFIYVSVFFSFIVLVNNKTYGNYLIWFIFLSSWLCDTSAYYAGRLLGKRKLCPKVSPKKTIEGSIGGMIGSILACTVYGQILVSKNILNIDIYHFVILGAICGILCQFGDLVASSIKRYVGVKDYSNLIPGHGGILDRFDSILFSAVVVYYYLTLIIGI